MYSRYWSMVSFYVSWWIKKGGHSFYGHSQYCGYY